jgi:hypothetical protein
MKVVLNKCFGGFSLSEEAVLWLREHGDPEALKGHFKGEIYVEDGVTHTVNWDSAFGYYVHSEYSERNNPLLVECVEILGSKVASGKFAALVVVDIPDDINWDIDDYDGVETLHESHMSW